jgi:hypothetical protein
MQLGQMLLPFPFCSLGSGLAEYFSLIFLNAFRFPLGSKPQSIFR